MFVAHSIAQGFKDLLIMALDTTLDWLLKARLQTTTGNDHLLSRVVAIDTAILIRATQCCIVQHHPIAVKKFTEVVL
jgi:hypothetical protein